MPRQVDALTTNDIKELASLAKYARELYSDTIKDTTANGGTLKTIRVPLALLANIQELADALCLRVD